MSTLQLRIDEGPNSTSFGIKLVKPKNQTPENFKFTVSAQWKPHILLLVDYEVGRSACMLA